MHGAARLLRRGRRRALREGLGTAAPHPPGAAGAARRRSAASGRPADPHAILGVPHGAPRGEVRRAYLQQVKRLHPDANPSPDAQRQFQCLQEAYDTLYSGAGQDVASAAAQSAASPDAGDRGNPMGSGMHYDEWLRFRAAQREGAQGVAREKPGAAAWYVEDLADGGVAWERREPPPTMWKILLSRRGWVRYGLVHRTLHASWARALGLWPLGLLLGIAVAARSAGPATPRAHGFSYDNFGRAWSRDKYGTERRLPEYDLVK